MPNPQKQLRNQAPETTGKVGKQVQAISEDDNQIKEKAESNSIEEKPFDAMSGPRFPIKLDIP